MSRVQALGYVGLSVSDMDAWLRFAVATLGLQAAPRVDGSVDLRMDAHATRVRLLPTGSDDIAYVGWEVADRAALEDTREALERHGCTVEAGSNRDAADRHVEALYRFADPEGLVSEIYFGPRLRTDQPFVSPMGVRFKTGRQGLGHVVLVARDAAAQEAFYRDVLGFRVSDYIHTEVIPGRPVSFTFMRCNGRHHSLAMAQLPLKKKLQHLMFEVQSIDDVGRALDRCQAAGLHLSLTLGRHSNDEMLSFYPMTPSGFDLEYGWGGLEVEDESWRVVTHGVNSAWGHRFQRPPRPALVGGPDEASKERAR